ncbi:hypothetical protein [Xenorhabdus lircayensis]|uniref:Uncharacterized protein n=1 Tax=Xenorhabdus lircayensis TaxID=2763499 RepID=A0ABS0U2Z5_9GAMM|nr:hypothetical protein [Xenorhabdus lircayensis]MBI6548232.1 hypothetical protein [Xenorhabdus lircayensis]
MNNDVIELAREIKRRSELVLQAERENNSEFYKHWNSLDRMMSPRNLIKLCDAVETLAEYENMEPVAWIMEDKVDSRIISDIEKKYLSNTEAFNIPLYRHPSKELSAFTAEIELTDFTKNWDGKAIAYGRVFNDSRKRFEDGVEIITSLVINADTYRNDGYIKTQNSIYKIRE